MARNGSENNITVENKSPGGDFLLVLVLAIIIVSVGYLYIKEGGISGLQRLGGELAEKGISRLTSPIKDMWSFDTASGKEIKKKLSVSLYDVPDKIDFKRDLMFGVDFSYGDDSDLSRYDVKSVGYECGVFRSEKNAKSIIVKGVFYNGPKICVVKAKDLGVIKESKDELSVGMRFSFFKSSMFSYDFYIASNMISKKEKDALKPIAVSEDGGPLKAEIGFASNRKTSGALIGDTDDSLIIRLSNVWNTGRIKIEKLDISLPNGISLKECEWTDSNGDTNLNSINIEGIGDISDKEVPLGCLVNIGSISGMKTFKGISLMAEYEFVEETTRMIQVEKSDEKESGGSDELA